MQSLVKAVLLISVLSLASSCGEDHAKILPGEASDRSQLIPVTLDNYEVAETNPAFNNITKLVGTNQFLHFPVSEFDLNNQAVVRVKSNRIRTSWEC